MVKVYRVEDKNGIGPYKGVFYRTSHFDYHGLNADPRVSPYQSGIPIDQHKDKVFGFTSKAALRKWFKYEDRKLLKKHNLIVNCYNATNVIRGFNNVQCIFIKPVDEPTNITNQFW